MTESLFEKDITPGDVEVTPPGLSRGSSAGSNGALGTLGAEIAGEASHASQGPADDRDVQLQAATDTARLPALDVGGDTLINYRLLISVKESGCLIGQSGQVIHLIRVETDTKAGISKLVAGSAERILTVSGTLDNCAAAIRYFLQALATAHAQHDVSFAHATFPLKKLLNIALVPGHTVLVRLLVPGTQMGLLFGARGSRIQQIQQQYGVLIIALKLFLPGSSERLVEVQGTVDDIHGALRVIGRCLIEDFSLIIGTSYYAPRPKLRNASDTLSFDNAVVGALIGKNGARIQGVRKLSGALITIADAPDANNQRAFTLSGTAAAVDKARSLLYHNLQRERERAEGADDASDLPTP